MAQRLKKDQSIDPVCNMRVDPAKAPAKYFNNGVEIYYCAPGCKAAKCKAHGRPLIGS